MRWAVPLFGLGLAAFWLPPASSDWLLMAWAATPGAAALLAALQTYCHASKLWQ